MPDLSYFIYHTILPLLEFFRHSLGNYGWAIIAVTILTKLVLLPLSIKQSISAKKMQENMAKIKPQMDKLKAKFEEKQKKHASEPAKLLEVQKEFQSEIMNLYKDNGGFNPLAGCLPVLAQFPILIALYWTFSAAPFQPAMMSLGIEASTNVPASISTETQLSNPTNFVHENGKIDRYQIETSIPKGQKLQIGQTYTIKLKNLNDKSTTPLNDNNIYWRLRSAKDTKAMHPDTVSLNMEKAKYLKQKTWFNDAIDFIPYDQNPLQKTITVKKEIDGKVFLEAVLLNNRAHQQFGFIQDLGKIGVYDAHTHAIHFDTVVLLILVILSFWLVSRMSSTPNSMPSLDPEQERMQKQMQTLMPLMFSVFFIFLPVPSAVFLYFTVSNVFQILQTYATNTWMNKQIDQ